MKVLFDTNVILDVLLDREPFSTHASQLMSMVERGELIGLVCAISITTIHYLVAKVLGRSKALVHVKAILSLFDVAPVNRPVLENALAPEFDDFEDAVIHEAARSFGADCIVTRDLRGFASSKIPALNPLQLIKLLEKG